MKITNQLKKQTLSFLNLPMMMLLFFAVIAPAYGQNTKDNNLTLNVQNRPVREVFQQVSTMTGYKFFYDQDIVDKAPNITLDVKNVTIQDILDRITSKTNLYFQLNNNTISVVYRKSEKDNIPVEHVGGKTIQLKGQVIDEGGDPLPGVTITVVGLVKGVITDIGGNYSIEVDQTDELEFSFVGLETQRIKVGNNTTLNVVMKEKIDELDEVTVVAFGKQKKESVIASITTINPAELKVPSSNLTTAFAGQMAGVIAYQRSGEPGADDADFFVRGITTFGTNRNPLILIDNIELTKTDLARLQPDDIASFSVMKDATATALYGARGANGVILVTTKQGEEGPTKVQFRMEHSLTSPTRKVEYADPITWMQLANEAVLTRDPAGYAPFTEEKIDNTINGTDPLRYPAVDWMGMLIKDNAYSQRYNLSLSGGGKVARYYVAGSYSLDDGIMKVDKRQNFNNNINNKAYTLRSNIELRLTSTTNMNVRLSGSFDDYSGPLTSGTDMFKNIIKSNTVLFPPYYPPTSKTQAVTFFISFTKKH